MTDTGRQAAKGRGANVNPPNRFLATHTEADYEHVEFDDEFLDGLENPATEYLPDASQSIISENDSPDVPFRYSLNPYRGCMHGCSYCYARPTHEYLGLSAGLDFETKVMVKHQAATLFREYLARPAWKPESITVSGVTDCYQPAERRFRLTRSCLEVALETGQPLGIITKNALVLRDLDLLRQMAARRLVHVNLSVTTLDAELGRSMEPRTSTPQARLRAIRTLAEAGVPVRVMVAPVVPGLTDLEIPSILQAASEAGAQGAGYVLLRLPLSVKPVFLEWLERTQPLKSQKVEAAIRSTRGGELSDGKVGSRMSGKGPLAEQIGQLFRTFARKHHLDGPLPAYDFDSFLAPASASGQMRLF